jgi:hypothetical protein
MSDYASLETEKRDISKWLVSFGECVRKLCLAMLKQCGLHSNQQQPG